MPTDTAKSPVARKKKTATKTKVKPKTNARKKTVAKKVKEGMGAICFYEFSSCAITPDALSTILKSEGMGAAPPISPTQCVKECGRAFRLGRGKKDKFMGEIAHDDDDMVVVGILQKKRPGEKRVSYDQVDSVTWDKKGNVFLSTGTNKDEQIQSAIEVLLNKIEHAQKYYGHEFLRPWLIQTELQLAGALKLKNSGGGPYYVTEEQMVKINKLERICNQIDGCILSILDVTPTSRGKKAVEHGVRNSLGSSLAQLESKIAEWKDAARRPRVDAVGSVLIDFKELKAQATLYKQALNIKVDDIESQLSDAEEILRKMLFQQEQSKASPGLVAKYKAVIAANEPCSDDGKYMLEISDLEAAGVPASGLKYAAFYSHGNGAGLALAELGYRGKINVDGGYLDLIPLQAAQAAA